MCPTPTERPTLRATQRFRRFEPAANPAAVRVPSRGARMPRFVSTAAPPVDAVAELSRLAVAVIGAGAIGRHACGHLARAGVGALAVCDPGVYKPESLLTQPIHPAELGQPKARVVAREIRRIAPETAVWVHEGPFEGLDATALAGADLVLLATDTIRAELECGQRCLHLGTPLIQASVHGATLTAQVRAWANDGDGPCPACGLGADERAALAAEVVFGCDGSPAARVDRPTMSPSHLCSLAASLAVNHVLRLALGLGGAVLDREVEFNGYTLGSRVAPLARNPRCAADHTVWARARADRPVADCTLRGLARLAGLEDGRALEHMTFRVAGSSWVERGICPHGHEQPVQRFLVPGASPGRCPDCDLPLRAQPFFTHEAPTGRRLVGRLDRPLGDLTSGRPDWTVVSDGGTATLFTDAPAGASLGRPIHEADPHQS